MTDATPGTGVPTGMTMMPGEQTPSGCTMACGPSGVSGSSGTSGPVEPPMDAELGLDARPSNPMCIARRPPVLTGAIATTGLGADNAMTGMYTGEMIMAMSAVRLGGVRYWFVGYRGGEIRSYRQPVDYGRAIDSGTRVMDLSGVISESGEGGLLGMALDPDFENNHRLYVTYTRGAGTAGCPSRQTGEVTWSTQLCEYVSRFTLVPSGAPITGWSLSGGEEIVPILNPLGFTGASGYTGPTGWVRKPADNHNGGAIAFGPGGYLFVTFGDGGGGGDTFHNAQSLTSPLGKVLRINAACPNANYVGCDMVPADNPIINGTQSLIYTYGHRNPWRLWIDKGTGEPWVADVGQERWEEVDHLVAGGNYGWPVREGAHCPNQSSTDVSACPLAGAINPIAEYVQDDGNGRNIASGGAIYRGTRLGGFSGSLLWGDFSSGDVWALRSPSGPTVNMSATTKNLDVNSAMMMYEDEQGEVYIVYGYDSRVLRIDPGAGAPVNTFPTVLSNTGCNNTAGLIPYDLNATLWSDDLDKKRWMALPDGQSVTLTANGDFDFPNGTVLIKEFSTTTKKLETRLFMRDDTGVWNGYTYRWNDAQSDAVLLDAPVNVDLSNKGHDFTWTFPATQCMTCHTSAAGFALGPQVDNLNRSTVYPSTNRRSNQLATLAHIGIISGVGAPSGAARMEDPFGTGPVDARARAYLHVNCAHCHQTGGGTPSMIDLRSSVSLDDMRVCNAEPSSTDTDLTGDPKIIVPGSPESSILFNRMIKPAYRMPKLGTSVLHGDANTLIHAWITSISECP